MKRILPLLALAGLMLTGAGCKSSAPNDPILRLSAQESIVQGKELLAKEKYDKARPYFEQRGFKLGNVKFERYEGVAAGVILRQFPLPGHPVSHEDAISLVVATADGAP